MIYYIDDQDCDFANDKMETGEKRQRCQISAAGENGIELDYLLK